MEIRIEIGTEEIFLGSADEFLEMNSYDDELEMFLSYFEESKEEQATYNGMTFYRELSLVWED